MTLDRGKLANVDRRLLAELDRTESWQVVKVPISEAGWSTWKRYCDVVGLSMGRAISALIHAELSSVVDEDVEARSEAIAERERLLDEREDELNRREERLDRRTRQADRRPSQAELERMAAELEPDDPGWSSESTVASEPDLAVFKGVGRNELCPCGSKRKFKSCHSNWYRENR